MFSTKLKQSVWQLYIWLVRLKLTIHVHAIYVSDYHKITTPCNEIYTQLKAQDVAEAVGALLPSRLLPKLLH